VAQRPKPARARPNHRPTTRRAQQRANPPKAQRNPSSNQSQPRRGLSEEQKRSIDEQMGARRYSPEELGAHTRTARSESELMPWQGTGHGPASKPFESDTPGVGKGKAVAWFLWKILRPVAKD
ncbi:hypothetical protein, partial [Nonomuraea ferruginea]